MGKTQDNILFHHFSFLLLFLLCVCLFALFLMSCDCNSVVLKCLKAIKERIQAFQKVHQHIFHAYHSFRGAFIQQRLRESLKWVSMVLGRCGFYLLGLHSVVWRQQGGKNHKEITPGARRPSIIKKYLLSDNNSSFFFFIF